ncbi:S1 RNA-binding domain-containing protein [Paludisphaera rhizosphaerae]|uniref:S1 RNA-binding domain-containing protein n=1 Tax=Paludisphaera rhizosphaerae TaxID=2711216 RepID=UPI0013EB467D|nr:S1 RNA-binding domain-containing protein [Paludisphaera rhizosphaerae]
MSVISDAEWPFGDHLSPDKAGEWAAVQAQLAVGESVRGPVIARRPFGVFVDIGVGFPALLEVIQFLDARQRRYSLDDYPAIGETITARVVAFNDQNRQVCLTQLTPHPYLDASR